MLKILPRPESETPPPEKTLSTPPPGQPGAAAAPAPARDPARYTLVREHGRGGIGRVLEVKDEDLGRSVALKELLGGADPDAEARFLREARITARLQHPSIVPVHDAGRWPDTGKPFYSMKLVSGRSLLALARDAKTLEARVALLPNVLAVAEALAYAHSQGIVHRDLKPANVMVGEYGETIVIDWGLAKDLREREGDTGHVTPAGAGDLTVAGSVMGTPAFMAPEQARGETVDARADVYALGAMTRFVLTGQLPHDGADAKEILRSLLAGAPRPLLEREPRIPSDLAAIVEKAMARDRDARYRDAGELAIDLRRFQTGQLVGAHAYSRRQLVARWVRRNRALSAVTAASILALTIGAAWFLVREKGLRQTAESARAKADQQSLSLLEQSGRVELDLGRPSRAAAYLAEAYRRDPKRLALRSLLTQSIAPLGATRVPLTGHTRDVVAAAYSADGTRIVTGAADKTVRLWDAASGKQLRLFEGSAGWVEDVAFSADGKWIAGASGNTIVWDAATGGAKLTLPTGGFRLAFSPDSKTLVVGGMRGGLLAVDVESGKMLLERPGYYRDRLSAIAFHPSGKTALTASWDGRIHLWDTRTWKETVTLEDHHAGLTTADFSDDGNWLLTADLAGRMHVRKATGEIVSAFAITRNGAQPNSAWFAPDGRTILSASHDGTVDVWHAASGMPLESLDTIPKGKMFDAALSPDGSAIVTTGLTGAEVWSLESGTGWKLAGSGAPGVLEVNPAARSARGEVVAGVEYPDHTQIVVWNGKTGERLREWTDLGQAHAIAFSAKGDRILSAGTDRQPARLWDGDGALIARLDGHPGRIVHDVEANTDGSLFATAGYDGRIVFWRAADGARTGTELQFEGRATAVAFSPDGTRVAATNENGVLVIAERETAKVLRTIPAHATWIQDVAYSADGRRIITAGRQDHVAKIWDAETGALLHELAGHGHNLSRASFSPDGALVATTSRDRTTRLWDAQTGELVRSFMGPLDSAVFDASGTSLFATGGGDYAVIWDLSLDPRSPDELSAFVAERSPWSLEDGRLVLRD